MAGNPPLQNPPLSLATEYAHWKGWRDKVYGRLHPSKKKRMVAYARQSLAVRGRMVYTEGPRRSELFHRPRGKFLNAAADCSQYVSSIAHWSGVRSVTDQDWTGTLYDKGKPLTKPVPGCIVIFGAKPGVHTALMVSENVCIGFGDPTGPDRNGLAGMDAYFKANGHPGHVFIDLTV